MLTLTDGWLLQWLSRAGDGIAWEYHNVVAAHNSLVPTHLRYPARFANATSVSAPDSCDTGHCMTTGYTGMVEVQPGVLLVAYDRRHGCDTWPEGHLNEVFSMRVHVT